MSQMNLNQLVNLDPINPSVQITPSPVEYTPSGLVGGQVQVGSPGVILTSYAPPDSKASMFFALAEIAKGVQTGINTFDQIATTQEKDRIQKAELEFDTISTDETLDPIQKQEKLNTYLKDVHTPYLGYKWRTAIANQVKKQWTSSQAQNEYYKSKFIEYISDWRKTNITQPLTPQIELGLLEKFGEDNLLVKDNDWYQVSLGDARDKVKEINLKFDLSSTRAAAAVQFPRIDRTNLLLYLTDALGDEGSEQFRQDNIAWDDLLKRAVNDPNLSRRDVYDLVQGKVDDYLKNLQEKDPNINPDYLLQYREVITQELNENAKVFIDVLPQVASIRAEKTAAGEIYITALTGNPEQIKDSLYTAFPSLSLEAKLKVIPTIPTTIKDSYDRSNPVVKVTRENEEISLNWNQLTIPEKINIIQRDLNSIVEDMEFSRDTIRIKRKWFEDDKGNRYYDQPPSDSKHNVVIGKTGEETQDQRIRRQDTISYDLIQRVNADFFMAGSNLYKKDQVESLTKEFTELKDLASVSSGLADFNEAKFRSVHALKRATGLTDDEVYGIMPWLIDFDETTTGVTPAVVANQISQSKPISDLLQSKNVDPGLIQLFVAGLSDLLTTGNKPGGSFSKTESKYPTEQDAGKDLIDDPRATWKYRRPGIRLGFEATEDARKLFKVNRILDETMRYSIRRETQFPYDKKDEEILTKLEQGMPLTPEEQQRVELRKKQETEAATQMYGVSDLNQLTWEAQMLPREQGGWGTKLTFDSAKNVKWTEVSEDGTVEGLSQEGRRAGLYFTAEANYRTTNRNMSGFDEYIKDLEKGIIMISQLGMDKTPPEILYPTLFAIQGLETSYGATLFADNPSSIFLSSLIKTITVNGVPRLRNELNNRSNENFKTLDVLMDLYTSGGSFGTNSIPFQNYASEDGTIYYKSNRAHAPTTKEFTSQLIRDIRSNSLVFYGERTSDTNSQHNSDNYVKNLAMAIGLGGSFKTNDEALETVYDVLLAPTLSRLENQSFIVHPNANIDVVMPGTTKPWNKLTATEKLVWYVQTGMDYGPADYFQTKLAMTLAVRNTQPLDTWANPLEMTATMKQVATIDDFYRRGRPEDTSVLTLGYSFTGEETIASYPNTSTIIERLPMVRMVAQDGTVINSLDLYKNAIDSIAVDGVLPSLDSMHESISQKGSAWETWAEEKLGRIYDEISDSRLGLQRGLWSEDVFIMGILARPVSSPVLENGTDPGLTSDGKSVSLDMALRFFGIADDPVLSNLRFTRNKQNETIPDRNSLPKNWSNEKINRLTELVKKPDVAVFEIIDEFASEIIRDDFRRLPIKFKMGLGDKFVEGRPRFTRNLDADQLMLGNIELGYIPPSGVSNSDTNPATSIRFLKVLDYLLKNQLEFSPTDLKSED